MVGHIFLLTSNFLFFWQLKRLEISFNSFKNKLYFNNNVLKFGFIIPKSFLMFLNNFIFLDYVNILSFISLFIQGLFLSLDFYFYKLLKVIGLGFRFVILKTNEVRLDLGWSHVLFYPLPYSVKIFKKQQRILVQGNIPKILGIFCAIIISLFKRSPYEFKGIFYHDEKFVKKIGKQRQK